MRIPGFKMRCLQNDSHWCSWEGESHFLIEDGELVSIWTITIGRIFIILFKDIDKFWFSGIRLC